MIPTLGAEGTTRVSSLCCSRVGGTLGGGAVEVMDGVFAEFEMKLLQIRSGRDASLARAIKEGGWLVVMGGARCLEWGAGKREAKVGEARRAGMSMSLQARHGSTGTKHCRQRWQKGQNLAIVHISAWPCPCPGSRYHLSPPEGPWMPPVEPSAVVAHRRRAHQESGETRPHAGSTSPAADDGDRMTKRIEQYGVAREREEESCARGQGPGLELTLSPSGPARCQTVDQRPAMLRSRGNIESQFELTMANTS